MKDDNFFDGIRVTGQEVFGPTDGPFEAPAKVRETGPLYMCADEVLADVAEEPTGSVATREPDAKSKDGGSGFPVDRRDFLKLFSASTMVGASACIRRPTEKVIPYAVQPIDQIPGVPTFYSTVCGECSAACGLVVKTREGRPVKIEGHPDNPISLGGTCALGQSALQALYHPERRRTPFIRHGNRLDPSNWDEAYEHVGARLQKATNVAILAGGTTGHRHQFFREWLKAIGHPESNLYTYEPNSLITSIAAAHKIAFDTEVIPRTDLRRAAVVVGIGSDFLEHGVSPVYQAKNFSSAHAFNGQTMGTFVQFESAMTQTGARADTRHVIAPSSEALAALLLVSSLYNNPNVRGSAAEKENVRKVLDANAQQVAGGYDLVGVPKVVFDAIAGDMLARPSVVLCGGSHTFDENGTVLQIAAIMANVLVGAYGSTLYIDRGWMTPSAKPGDMARFIKDDGKIDVLFIVETNPAFTLPPSWSFVETVGRIPTIVSIQSFPCETDEIATHVFNSHHFLEAWGDEHPVAGFWAARQPVVRQTTGSRQTEDMFLWLAATVGKPMPFADYRTYLDNKWKAVFDAMAPKISFETFMQAVRRRGFVGKLQAQSVSSLQDLSIFRIMRGQTQANALRLSAPFSTNLWDGRGANRPILQEIGDTLTTVTWDSWVSMNPNTMRDMGLKYNDVVRVESMAGSFEASVYPLPGVHRGLVVAGRGNGHGDVFGTVSKGVGTNPLTVFPRSGDTVTGDAVTDGIVVQVTRTGKQHRLAAMQKKNDIANRTDIVRLMSLATAMKPSEKPRDLDKVPDLYPKLKESEDYRWGMAIDLGKCTGCGACMVACSQENNVPQVGREEIYKGREMHWIRLDRYFAGDVDNPTVVYQPMLCQHCNHAPCEAVCPVYATTHDPEGFNAQTYNRCVGTRYCANACPYKIRRFNWWTHKWGVMGDLPKDRNPRALNPDVTVRTRGIMEKCTFCYQRIAEAKFRAKERGRKVSDGEIRVACEQVCPSDAITFGNLKDPASRVSQARKEKRAYLALGGNPDHGEYGIKTLPNVNYLASVTLKEPTFWPGATTTAGAHGSGAQGHHGDAPAEGVLEDMQPHPAAPTGGSGSDEHK